MKYLFIGFVFLLSGCVSTSNTNVMSLIEQTAEVAPEGIDGDFVLTVKAAGKRGQVVYLNTELDYRDRRNITIALSPRLTSYIQSQYGVPAQEYYINKVIQVTGTARQVKIGFFSKGELTEKYYFQTHIRISSPTQIDVL
jgi:hypothetical protein